MQPVYFNALELVNMFKPIVFDHEVELPRKRLPDLSVDGGFPVVSQARIGPEQTMYEE
jgi:hypothetical protein